MRKLIVIAAVSAIGGAIFAPGALGQVEPNQEPGDARPHSGAERVGVVNEATGAVCGAVTVINDAVFGNCPLHASSPSVVDAISHTFFGESVTARCLNEFEGAINGAGEGRIGAAQIVFTNPASGGIDCTGTGAVRPCSEAEAASLGADHQANWHYELYEDHTTGRLWLRMHKICLTELNPFGSSVGGGLWLRVAEDAAGHPTAASATDVQLDDAEVPTGEAEFTGSWSLEQDATHGGIEVTH